MKYLIDSDLMIDQLKNVLDVVALLDQLAVEGLGMSIITDMETYQGTIREGPESASQAMRLAELLLVLPIVPFTPAIARRCARLRQSLKQPGRAVRSRAFDLIIASTAMEHGLTLVTRNVVDYRDIPGLLLYQWR